MELSSASSTPDAALGRLCRAPRFRFLAAPPVALAFLDAAITLLPSGLAKSLFWQVNLFSSSSSSPDFAPSLCLSPHASSACGEEFASAPLVTFGGLAVAEFGSCRAGVHNASPSCSSPCRKVRPSRAKLGSATPFDDDELEMSMRRSVRGGCCDGPAGGAAVAQSKLVSPLASASGFCTLRVAN